MMDPRIAKLLAQLAIEYRHIASENLKQTEQVLAEEEESEFDSPKDLMDQCVEQKSRLEKAIEICDEGLEAIKEEMR